MSHPALDGHGLAWVTDAGWRILGVSGGFCGLSGYGRGELLGRDLRALGIASEGAEWAEIERAVSESACWKGEVCIRERSGSRRWLECTIAGSRGVSGRLERVVSVAVDVTERRMMAERLALAAEGSADGLFEWSSEIGRLWVSPRLMALLGLSPHEQPREVCGWLSLVHQSDRAGFEEAVAVHAASGASLDHESRLLVRGSGYRWFRVRAKSVKGPDGRVSRIAGSLSDIHAMRELVDRLEMAVAAAQAGVWDWRVRSGRITTSDVFWSMLGDRGGSRVISVEELAGLVHREDLARMYRALDAVLSGTSERYDIEYRLRCAGSGHTWVRSTGGVIERSPEGAPLRVIGQHIDVNQQMRLREELEEAQRVARVGHWYYDVASGRVEWSEQLFEMFGRDRSLGMPGVAEALAAFHPEDQRLVADAVTAAREHGRPYRVLARAASGEGELRWLRNDGRVRLDDDGRVVTVFGTTLDITEQVERERELAALESRLRLFVEHTPAAVAMFDNSMRYLVASRGWHEQYGLEGSEVVGRTHYEVFPTIPDRWKELHRRALAGEVIASERDWFDGVDGRRVWVRYQIHPWHGRDGKQGGIVMFTEVITAQIDREQRLEEALRRAEAASLAKSAFLANMSHEIRTPMNAILGYAELLDGGVDSAAGAEGVEAVGGAAKAIRSNAHHLLTIINDILDMSKIESGRLEVECLEMDPAVVLEQAVSLLMPRAAEKGLELRLVWESPAPRSIRSDPVRLRQVLLNLLGNAIKFTESGGVCVRAWCEPEAQRFTVAVEDTGIGMTEEQRRSIERFEAFVQADGSMTRRFGGTGLGLRISQELARMLGGGISIASSWGVGSTFTVHVATGDLSGVAMGHPGTGVVAPAAELPAAAVSRPLEGRTVLLVEDGIDNRRLMSFHLARAGATVRCAEHGLDALRQLREEPASAWPHLVLLDMQMPELDGYETASRMRDMGLSAPILAITANAMVGDRERCISGGCDDYRTKPIDGAALVAACVRLLEGTDLERRRYA